MNTVEALLKQSCVLSEVSDSAYLDVELLLGFCLQKPRSYLRAWPEALVSDAVVKRFLQLLSRRQRGEPVAYLIGEQGFWSLDLQVNETTLIPRPETELMVEVALRLLHEHSHARVLDLGTGTGAIALALASEKPGWQLTACDKEAGAVSLALQNRQALGLTNVNVVQSDWYEQIGGPPFDLIVSNPPYIDADDPHLQGVGVCYEPRSALVADNQGLADIAHIIEHADGYLKSGAWLMLEHGYDQAGAVQQLLLKRGFKQLFCEQDLSGIDRVSGGRWI